MPLTEGSPAPDFQAQDQHGATHRLTDYVGRYLLLYFYPRDNTPGCTKEACQFRDYYAALKDRVAILGVSSDSVQSHANFASQFQLPFPLLADHDLAIIKAYGADGETLPKRCSFLIGPEGKIVKIYRTVQPEEHAEQVLADLSALAK